MRRLLFLSAVFTILLFAFATAQADDVLLLMDDAPPDGLVVGQLNLTAAAQWCKLGPIRPQSLEAIETADGSTRTIYCGFTKSASRRPFIPTT